MASVDVLYYTVADVAELLQCDRHRVSALIKQKKLKAFKLGKQYRISATALADCITLLEKETDL